MNLDRYRDRELGLAPLVAAAHELLVAAGGGASDERVATFPDARTVRYYQSIGVLDRPLRYDGREAVYGYRHLLQAVVTKLLQAEGYSLAQVQRALLGRPTEALEAAVAEALTGSPAPSTPLPAPSAASPAPLAALPAPAPITPVAAPPSSAPRALLTREVAPGVLVTVDPRVVHDPDDTFTRLTIALTGATR